MHDAGPRGVAAGVRGDLPHDRVHERARRVAVRGVHDEARGLVHHERVVVLVQDVDRDVLAEERERGCRVGHVDDDRVAGAKLVRRLDRGTACGDVTVAGEPLDRAPAELRALGEESIDALAGLVGAQLEPLAHACLRSRGC